MSQASIPSFSPGQFGGPGTTSTAEGARRQVTQRAPPPPLVVIGGLSGAALGALVTLVIAATGVLAGSVTPFAVMGFGTVGAALIGAVAGRFMVARARQPDQGWA